MKITKVAVIVVAVLLLPFVLALILAGYDLFWGLFWRWFA
jgi:hypothetical protein